MTDIIDILAPVEQEGTKAIIKAWYIAAGETINEGDPLVELETDKVAVEVPAPASGTLSEILVQIDGEAEPGAVLGRLTSGNVAIVGSTVEATSATMSFDASSKTANKTRTNGVSPPLSNEIVREHRLSPSVRRLVQEHALDPQQINGSGKGGRLTRLDVLQFLDAGGDASSAAVTAKSPSKIELSGDVVEADIGRATRVPHSSMRRRIAEHMSQSVATAPHVTAIFEADFSAIIRHRNIHKEAYGKKGVKLTYTAYIIAACVEAMKVSPSVNSRWYDDHLDVYDDINIGVGVALGDKGLIVPVVQEAQSRSHFGIAEELHRLTDAARDSKLAPKDVRGGTFSISNHGTSGSLVASPIIINQPQSAILGVGKLEKRVVVREVDGIDAMQIRPMAFVSLTIDHRVIDGAQTNAWLSRFVEVLEGWEG